MYCKNLRKKENNGPDIKLIRSSLLILSFTLLLLGIVRSYALTLPSDHQIKLTGKVVDAKTGALIEATVRYTSLPHGNMTGIRNFNGHYHLTLQRNYSYHFEISAAGYQPLTITIAATAADSMLYDFHLQKAYQKGGLIQLPDKILFERGKSDINTASYEVLQGLVRTLKENPRIHIRLEGHTDQGDRQSLMSLSEDRVAAVKQYLVAQGIHRKRIKTKAFGGSFPLSHAQTPEAHSLNRRVEIRIIRL